MQGFDHLLKSCEVGDVLDDIASSDPPAYLRRCFAEGLSAPALSPARVQQLAVCAMVLDAILNGRDYESFEPELIADWRAQYHGRCQAIKDTALGSLRRARTQVPTDPDSSAELAELEHRLASAE